MRKDGTLSAAEQALLDVVRAEPGIRVSDAQKKAGIPRYAYAGLVVYTLRVHGYLEPSDPDAVGELWATDNWKPEKDVYCGALTPGF